MTDAVATGPGAVPADVSPAEPKDYWDLVLEKLARRRLFRAALFVLTLLYGVAAFAPVLVSDRPYVVEAVDLEGYAGAVRTLRATVVGLERVAKQDDAAYADSLVGKPAAPPHRGAAFAAELHAARLRIATLRRYLPQAEAAPVDEVARLVGEAAAAFGVDDGFLAGAAAAGLFDAGTPLRRERVPAWPGPVDGARALEALAAAKARAGTFAKALAPWDPAKPDVPGVDLVGQRSYPLARSLRPVDAALMALWLVVAAWPIWNRLVNNVLLGGHRARIRRARVWKLCAALSVAVAVGLAWRGFVGDGRTGLDQAPYKEGLARGSIHLVAAGRTLREASADQGGVAGHRGRVTFAPVPFGYAETNAAEKFRPPTWLAAGELDPTTGLLVHPDWRPAEGAQGQPFVPRAGEPDVNAWHRRLAGTDELGRDVFGRLVWGSRVSLSVGVVSAALLVLIGVLMGALAGYFGGWVDLAVMRLVEVLQSIPSFFLILLVMAFTNPDDVPPIIAIVVVIGCVSWTGVARLVRGEFLRLREQEFVLAARALGFSSARIIARHVLPNAMSPVLVAGAFAVAAGILNESAISFLGFGVRPPDASWGSLVNESKNPQNWWIQVAPGLAIFVTVTCYNLVGDAVRDALDPKQQG